MITPEEFVARWGNTDELIRYEPAVVESLAIPQVSKRFLIEAGLPRQHAYTRFDLPPNNLPPAPGILPGFALSADYARYRLLGATVNQYKPGKYTELYCLDEQNRGKVVKIYHPQVRKDGIRYPDMDRYEVFPLNTNVPYLAEMLLLIEEEYRWLYTNNQADYDAVQAHCNEVAKAMRQVDRTALRGGQGWSMTILSMRNCY